MSPLEKNLKLAIDRGAIGPADGDAPQGKHSLQMREQLRKGIHKRRVKFRHRIDRLRWFWFVRHNR